MGVSNWEGLLSPLILHLRQLILRCGDLIQATYDSFNNDKISPYCGSSRYGKTSFFHKVMFDNPSDFTVTSYLYACGIKRLPLSTASLIQASHLAFTAMFTFLLVRQRFTPFNVNAVVLLTLGAVVLALRTSGDRPVGESTREYAVGFVMILAAAVLYGFVLPLMELVYKKTKQSVTR